MNDLASRLFSWQSFSGILLDAHRDERPNIVPIMADDLGSHGQQLSQTPLLDQLASEEMRFTCNYFMTSFC